MKKISLIALFLLAVTTMSQAQVLSNGTFEACTDEYNWTGTGWSTWGDFRNQSWASHTGNRGAFIPGWDTATGNGGLYQDVACSTTGTYTFSVWVLAEKGFNPTKFDIKLEYYAVNHSTVVQTETVVSNLASPRDGFWHQYYVTGVATSPSMAFIRPVIGLDWTTSTNSDAGTACMLDDAQIYQGSYTGVPLFGISGFEYDSWRGSEWAAVEEDGWSPETWANRTGSRGVGMEGWSWTTEEVVTNEMVVTTNIIVHAPTNIVNEMSRPVTMVGTGTYTFSCWMSREADFKMSNAQIRIEFFDTSRMTKVQADVVTNFLVPNDNWWREYYVVGVCTSPSVFEIRPVVQVTWDRITNDGSRGARIDDARFRRGSHAGSSFVTDWAYHGGMEDDPMMENVPGTNVGTFLQVNHTTRTNTFYALSSLQPLALYASEGDSAGVGLRTSWQRPDDSVWMNSDVPMTPIGNVEIPSSQQFHGLPGSGTTTAMLWRVALPQPTNASGSFYTNSIRIYYAPYLKATNGDVATDHKYMVMMNGDFTNNVDQAFAWKYADVDYYIDNYKPATVSVFTNGGFENPTPVAADLEGTAWYGWGDVGRETWAARSGGAGAVFRSWNSGSFGLYQDVATTTGGTFQFTGWVRMETGALPTRLEMKMQWFDKNGSLVQENVENVLTLFKKEDGDWSRVGVVGSCSSTNLDYVRLQLDGQYNSIVGGNAATRIDDLEFGPVAISLQNTGFEVGNWRDIRDWYGAPQWLVHIESWASRLGTNGAAFHGWEEDAARYEALLRQPVAASTTGSYVFTAWIKRETGFINLTNAKMRLEWYGGDYPNKVQADTEVTLSLPLDGAWYLYSVTGTCSDADLRFVQPVILAQWNMNPSADGRTIQIDDAVLLYTNLAGGETYTDGIPDSWLILHGLGTTNGVGAGDDDSDGNPNVNEYVADTDPLSALSSYSNAVEITSGRAVLIIMAGPPTTNSRRYEVYWKTNLLESGDWMPYGLNVPGNADGSAVSLTVTNELGKRFYRSGVKLP
ncbi:MAG TPA: hypothetical protein PLE77_05785 [Kiritimatiellia bacterium]|nr:hypothetical protein [Kiritimatiellia bacterium]